METGESREVFKNKTLKVLEMWTWERQFWRSGGQALWSVGGMCKGLNERLAAAALCSSRARTSGQEFYTRFWACFTVGLLKLFDWAGKERQGEWETDPNLSALDFIMGTVHRLILTHQVTQWFVRNTLYLHAGLHIYVPLNFGRMLY